MKANGLLILLLILAFPAQARNKIEWLNKEIDFGYVPEEGGEREGVFRFVNKGRKKIEIKEVKVACGCTRVDYTKGKIAKGDTAEVRVWFDPEDRPGKFDKGVYVEVGKNTLPENLRIKGVVMASDETLKLCYPEGKESMRLDKGVLDFGDIKRGNRRRDFIEIYNTGVGVIKPEIESDNAALSWTMEPEEIGRGETGTITIYIDTTRLTWVGNREGTLLIKTGEEEPIEVKVKANVTISEPDYTQPQKAKP